MAAGHDHVTVPPIAGQQHHVGEQLLRARGDREVDAVELRHFGDLLGCALVQVQADVWVALAKRLDHARQHVTRLGVRRADRERAARLVAQLLRQALDALDFAQDPQRPLDDLLAGGRDLREVAAVARKDLKAELVLEQLELLADARLRSVQFLRGGSDVESVLGDRREVAQLMELHGPQTLCNSSRQLKRCLRFGGAQQGARAAGGAGKLELARAAILLGEAQVEEVIEGEQAAQLCPGAGIGAAATEMDDAQCSPGSEQRQPACVELGLTRHAHDDVVGPVDGGRRFLDIEHLPHMPGSGSGRLRLMSASSKPVSFGRESGPARRCRP